jgi:hypothetical protein
MPRIDRASEIRKVRAYVKNAESEIGKLRIIPRVTRGYRHRYPFDLVGLANLSKAFALAKACLKLLASDHADEAHGLSRSLVECAMNLRYLTTDPVLQDGRTRDFAKFAMADKAFWYHYALENTKNRKDKAELHAYAKQLGIVANTKPARQHWAGKGSGFVWYVAMLDHPLDGPMTVKHRKNAYAVDYYQTSAFVHCSLPAIDSYYADDGVPFCISASSGIHETFQSTLFVILVYIHSAIAYVLFGLNIDRPARLNTLFQTTLNNMKPVPTRHKSARTEKKAGGPL